MSVRNCDSSSIKFALFDARAQPLLEAQPRGARVALELYVRRIVRVAVEPTNEEWIAASHALRALSEVRHAAQS